METPTAFDQVPEGFAKLDPLAMNAVTFNARRTLITPQLIDQLARQDIRKQNSSPSTIKITPQ